MAYLAARTAAARHGSKAKERKENLHQHHRSTDSKDWVGKGHAMDDRGDKKHEPFVSDNGTARQLRHSATGHDYDMPALQWKVKACYTNSKTEVIVAILIGVNFVISVVKFQICPKDIDGMLYCYGESPDTSCLNNGEDILLDSTCGKPLIIKGDTCTPTGSETYETCAARIFGIDSKERKGKCEADSGCTFYKGKWEKKGDGRAFTDACSDKPACTSLDRHPVFVDIFEDMTSEFSDCFDEAGAIVEAHEIQSTCENAGNSWKVNQARCEEGTCEGGICEKHIYSFGCTVATMPNTVSCGSEQACSAAGYNYVCEQKKGCLDDDACLDDDGNAFEDKTPGGDWTESACETAGGIFKNGGNRAFEDQLEEGGKWTKTACEKAGGTLKSGEDLWGTKACEGLAACTICSPVGPLASSPGHSTFFLAAEWFFALAFGIELVINMTAHTGRCCKRIYVADADGHATTTPKENGCTCNTRDWYWREFFCGPNRGWNIFDFVIVIISLLSVTLPPGQIPGMGILRLFRAFRVFRLFARLGELKKVITAMEQSLPGVGSASLVLILVIMIFAILGVEFFREFPDKYLLGSKYGWVCKLDGSMVEDAANPDLDPTPTGPCTFHDPDAWGEEYFGTFMKAMFTLFQVLTGESWAEAVARPATLHYWPSSIFFIIYVLICGYILINVVIAVLLDKMMTYDPDEGQTPDLEDVTWVNCPECYGKGHLVGDDLTQIMCSKCKGRGEVNMETLFTADYMEKEAKTTLQAIKAVSARVAQQLARLEKKYNLPGPSDNGDEPAHAAGAGRPMSYDAEKPAYDDPVKNGRATGR